MIEKILTDNSVEKQVAKWDGERFALVTAYKEEARQTKVIFLSPVETIHLLKFLQEIPELRSGVA